MEEPTATPDHPCHWAASTLRAILSRESLLLLGATVLLVAHRQLGRGPSRALWPFEPGYWWYATAIVAFLLLPLLLIVLFLRQPPTDFGLAVGRVKEWLPAVLILYLLVFPFLYFASHQPQFRALYPLLPTARVGGPALVRFELTYGAYFFAWEFFFRGFLLFGLAKKFGPLAIPLQTVPFVFAHLNKPYPEVYASLFAGLALGALALRTRSMLPCFLLHWAAALTLDLLVLYR